MSFCNPGHVEAQQNPQYEHSTTTVCKCQVCASVSMHVTYSTLVCMNVCNTAYLSAWMYVTAYLSAWICNIAYLSAQISRLPTHVLNSFVQTFSGFLPASLQYKQHQYMLSHSSSVLLLYSQWIWKMASSFLIMTVTIIVIITICSTPSSSLFRALDHKSSNTSMISLLFQKVIIKVAYSAACKNVLCISQANGKQFGSDKMWMSPESHTAWLLQATGTRETSCCLETWIQC